MMFRKISIIFTLAFFLSACEGSGKGEKETVGTLLGAGLGALAGAQFGDGRGTLVATAIGALAGAYIGGEAGKSLDKADLAYAQKTTQDTLEYNQTGQASTWRNPDSGNSGGIEPTRTFVANDGAHCRDFQTTINIDGDTEIANGTACRQPDGSWRIVR